MLLVAYLNQSSVRHRPLHDSERALLGPMIRRSDNSAASAIFVRLGTHRLRALARRTGMRRFTPAAPIWGNSRIDAEDQARFFLHIDRTIARRHRRYAMSLLEHITRSQRWGIGRVRPPGWRLFFKGGWGSGTGRVDHQVALLTKGDRRLSLAILTEADGSHAYGKETLRGVARRLRRGASQRPAPAGGAAPLQGQRGGAGGGGPRSAARMYPGGPGDRGVGTLGGGAGGGAGEAVGVPLLRPGPVARRPRVSGEIGVRRS